MNYTLIELDWGDLGWMLGLLGAAIALLQWQGLTLTGQLLWAGGRTILQLIVVGYFLAVVFSLQNPWAVLAVLAIMLTIAAVVAKNRINPQNRQLFWGLWLSIGASTALGLSYSLAVIIQPPQWYSPQYLIPLTGMVLGNTMNSASLAGERLASAIQQNPREIETHLCLGASPLQAIAAYRRAAIQASLIPTINQMMVVGLVSLPGMFTGQVLAGGDPLNAAVYQILIMFLILLSNTLSTIAVTAIVYRQYFSPHQQLRLVS
ncbi:MAG: ABC transporter permease [Synechocystis sp.]|jgi:putative ABC transport system permease protein